MPRAYKIILIIITYSAHVCLIYLTHYFTSVDIVFETIILIYGCILLRTRHAQTDKSRLFISYVSLLKIDYVVVSKL